jgi:PAS domain S-box-containing protein
MSHRGSPHSRMSMVPGVNESRDITDRKRALQELQESEQKFRTIFRDAPAGMTMVSLDGRFLAVNKAFCDFLGYTEEELLSTDVASITHPEDRAATLQRLNILRDRPDSERIEKRYLHKNGQTRWGDLSRSLIRDSEGKPAYMVSQIVDITERKRVEAELRQRESELKEAQRVAQVGSWKSDLETDILTWSDEMYRIHGLDPGLPPPSFSDLAQFFTAESWARLRASIEKALETGRVASLDLELVRPDGSKRWISTRGEVERNATGRIVRLRGTAQDITERKLAEQALRETEARFRTIANSAPVMIWMSGPDKLCTYFNQPWLDFTGRPLTAELGNGWAEGVHPDDLAQCMETYNRSFDQREPFKIEYRLRRHDGEYRWIVDTGVPRTNLDGSFAGYIGSCVDDTSRQAGEEALRTVSGKLIEAQEKERKRIARELHDNINQRLALLSIQLQQLQDAPRGARLRKRIEELFTHTTRISSDVQALSHRLHSASLDHLGLVPAIKVFCDELAQHRKVDIAFVHSSVPTSVPPDVALGLFRVLQEALHNAVKHSKVRNFEVQLMGRPGEIELKVRDSGVGFGLEPTMHGPGLGLISMRERVHLLKGALTIASRPMHGTEITVRVPVESSATVPFPLEKSA